MNLEETNSKLDLIQKRVGDLLELNTRLIKNNRKALHLLVDAKEALVDAEKYEEAEVIKKFLDTWIEKQGGLIA